MPGFGLGRKLLRKCLNRWWRGAEALLRWDGEDPGPRPRSTRSRLAVPLGQREDPQRLGTNTLLFSGKDA